MIRASELLTLLGAGVSVMGLALAATLYVGGPPFKVSVGQQEQKQQVISEKRRAFDLSDSFFSCREHIPNSIPFKVRNIDVDTRSSRYDEKHNAYVVFIDLEVREKSRDFYNKHSYQAKIICRVSAADNQILSFKVRRV